MASWPIHIVEIINWFHPTWWKDSPTLKTMSLGFSKANNAKKGPKRAFLEEIPVLRELRLFLR